MRRTSPALVAAALGVAVALVAGTATLWPRDHPTIAPAGAPAATATQPAPDPEILQRLVDGVVEAGAPGAVALIRTGQRTWQGLAASVTCMPGTRRAPPTGSGSAA